MIKAPSIDSIVASASSPPAEGRRVYVIDDNSDIRRSLHFSLATINVVAWPFMCAADFLEQASGLSPAPILLDMRMPGIDGLELLAILREREIDWPVIMMSAHGDIPIAVRAIRLGAVGFLGKPFDFEDLCSLLDEAYVTLSDASQLHSARAAARAAWSRLTRREAEVLELLAKGAANKTVANQLGLSVRTIEIHRARGLAKLERKTLSEVVVLKFTAASTNFAERSAAS